MSAVKILFLGANARNTTRVQVGLEVSEVKEEIAKAGAGDLFEVELELAVRPEQLQRHLQRHAPDVLHFSGHGARGEGSDGASLRGPTRDLLEDDAAAQDAGGILLEDRSGAAVAVRPAALTKLIEIVQRGASVRCVVLNACFTKAQAEDIAAHVDCVIGMKHAIDDAAAIAFATGFYRALAQGESIKTAFDLGCNEIDLRGLRDKDVPDLIHRSDRDPDTIVLRPAEAPSPATPRQAIARPSVTLRWTAVALAVLGGAVGVGMRWVPQEWGLSRPPAPSGGALEYMATPDGAVGGTPASAAARAEVPQPERMQPEPAQPEVPAPLTPPGKPHGRVAGAPAGTATAAAATVGTVFPGPRGTGDAAAPARAGDAGAMTETRTEDIELGDRGKVKGGNVEGTGTSKIETGNIKCGDDCELELGNVKNT